MDKTEVKKVKKIKCVVCKKKLGLLPFDCKCDGKFCASHRAPETHNCSFDFRAEGCKKLEQKLVKVVGEKIAAI
jgi:predicted nucleic acid binding AN1-type Zn finger protein